MAAQRAFPSYFERYQTHLASLLEAIVPADDVHPETVHRAMRYTLMAPSKRVRGILSLLSAELAGQEPRAEQMAAAIELVHAASLILDDLPSMDDAPVRRGRPACHVAFGEATAILASFGLLSLGFATIARAYPSPLASRLTMLLADAVGTSGLIGGQADDLLATQRAITFERLERIHRLKTGALFSAAAVGGALTAGADDTTMSAIVAYAKNLGLAFQIIDDLLDVEGTPEQTGKLTRQDVKKTTFVSFSGVDGARQLARELCETADGALQPFGRRADRLRELSAFVADRCR